jgi:hypothetical protein
MNALAVRTSRRIGWLLFVLGVFLVRLAVAEGGALRHDAEQTLRGAPGPVRPVSHSLTIC